MLLFEKILKIRWLQHLLFWIFSFYVLSKTFAYGDEVLLVDWVYTFLFHLSLWLAVYPNLVWLIPGLLRKGKYWNYGCLLIASILMSIGFNVFTFNYLSDILFPGYYFISYYNFFDLLKFTSTYAGITTLLKLSKGWFKYQESQRLIDKLYHEKLDTELAALKAQVNPHFLFNSLNNIYALSLDQDKRTPALILGLSDMMRYLLYESDPEKVPLKKEIAHLKNYVDLQRLSAEEEVQIEFNIFGDPSAKEIAPLLFLPIIENGFKHGIKGDIEGAFIRIKLDIHATFLTLEVTNNKGQHEEAELEKPKGIGLKNLRQRLALLYPGKHILEIKEDHQIFSVLLKLEGI